MKEILRQKADVKRKNIRKIINQPKEFSKDKKLGKLDYKILKNEGRLQFLSRTSL